MTNQRLSLIVGSFVILCLGALNTPRLVLFSSRDFRTRLPLLENPTSFTPLVAPRQIGSPVDERSYSSQLSLVYSGPLHDEPIIGMLYSLDGLLRSDLMFNFPLSGRGCLTAARYLLPGAPVWLAGVSVGRVESVRFSDFGSDETLLVTLHIDQ